jgi:hypothetical protein
MPQWGKDRILGEEGLYFFGGASRGSITSYNAVTVGHVKPWNGRRSSGTFLWVFFFGGEGRFTFPKTFYSQKLYLILT